jgi:hypothetical protein
MEKLELKHLAPYLPYGIEIIHGVTRKKITAVSLDSNFIFTTTYLGSRDKQMLLISDVKPILRPLSDIQKFEDIMDEFSVRSFEAFENHFFDRALGRSLNCFDNVNYTIIELCFKHHLDIFDLIPKGLAISYSDVQSTSNEG